MSTDLISRSALLATYDAAHKGSPGGARKLIEEAPAIEDEYRWHDLGKDPWDLPTENKMYIVTIKSYSGSVRTDFRFFERTTLRGKIVERWKYPWENITNENITHWQERPQPAGGEDDAEIH